MPQYRLLNDAFIAPDYIKAGSVIDYDGPFGPHFEPIDAEGEAARIAYFKANPDAMISPFDLLPMKVGEDNAIAPKARVIQEPAAIPMEQGTSLAESLSKRAEPGLSETGGSGARILSKAPEGIGPVRKN